MEKGIQLNDKAGNILINVYEPDGSKAQEAVELLYAIKKLIAAKEPTPAPAVASAPSSGFRQAAPFGTPPGAAPKYCLKGNETGAHNIPVEMKYVKFKDGPRPDSYNPGKMKEGFWSCDACFQHKKAAGGFTPAPAAAPSAPVPPPQPTPVSGGAVTANGDYTPPTPDEVSAIFGDDIQF